MPIYENLVIGNFLYALGLKMGAHRREGLAPDLAVNLVQQCPLDIVLGDVLLTGLKAVALLEFKREANWKGRWKERSKLLKIEAFLKCPEFQELHDTSRQIHFYVETKDILEPCFSRVLPYLDLRTDKRGISLEQLIDSLAFRARSDPELTETQREACQRYLNLICRSQSLSYPHTSPGLLVGVGADGQIAFAPVDDIRNLGTTFAAIREYEVIRERQIIRERQRQYGAERQRQIDAERQRQRQRQRHYGLER